eukprot:2463026-Amphidinium_carterae.2
MSLEMSVESPPSEKDVLQMAAEVQKMLDIVDLICDEGTRACYDAYLRDQDIEPVVEMLALSPSGQHCHLSLRWTMCVSFQHYW